MNTRFLMLVIFTVGISAGWFGKTWLLHLQTDSNRTVAGSQINDNQANNNLNSTGTIAQTEGVSANNRQTSDTALVNSNNLTTLNTDNRLSQNKQAKVQSNSNSTSVITTFKKHLRGRDYESAMVLFQETRQQNSQIAHQMRVSILDELKRLSEAQNHTDFPALTESYLSVYYDDIDVLLLQADFLHTGGNDLEAVDIYLLAKTYAYSSTDQRKVDNHFDDFVKTTDYSYTRQRNWGPLINLYSHISTSGLMTSTFQYQQALAHLGSGDQFYAVELLNQLLHDSQVGKSAAIALNNLTSGTQIPAPVRSADLEDGQSIALQKAGNQFLVDLKNNRQDSVKLLIDTGASMTAMSRASFDLLNTNGDAIQQDTRIFRTANGPTTGTVFIVPELILGSYLLKNTQVAVINFGADRTIDGLLGMNILGQFRFQIDQENAQLLLSNKE